MVEWSITAVLKTAVLRGTGGSNPSLSAKKNEQLVLLVFLFALLPKQVSHNSITNKNTFRRQT